MPSWITAASFALLSASGALSSPSPSRYPISLDTKSALAPGLANIHIAFNAAVDEILSFTYGSCSSVSKRDIDEDYVLIASGHGSEMRSSGDHRLVWIVPEDVTSGGCLSAWIEESGILVGRSEAKTLALSKKQKRASAQEMRKRDASLQKRQSGNESIVMSIDAGFDTLGPWFDGVELLTGKDVSSVDVQAAKDKEITIVGAGMSGLMTFLCLHQAGFTNVSIVEAGQRLGGRVHTVYLTGGPFDYSYQEMGPMRFPETFTNSLTNVTVPIKDHQLVFQLAAEMNTLNNHSPNLSVDFIPWYQSSPNGLYYYDGIRKANGEVPTVTEVADNANLSVSETYDASYLELEEIYEEMFDNQTFLEELATNMFKAHSEFTAIGLDGLGGDDWSEFGFVHNYLNYSLNDTTILTGAGASSFWDTFYDGLYFSAATWRTINGGLNRLPLSFHPLVDNYTSINTKIERVSYNADTSKITLQHRQNFTAAYENITTDYAIFALPFNIVTKWRFTPSLPLTISNAIEVMPFEPACKVALEFSSRFWEHLDNPIYGSCSTVTDIPGIGSICYPSYNINGTGPATMLGSYISGDGWGERWVSASEEEHVQYVLDAMIEIHGDVAKEQFTGNYNRRCWLLDEYEGGSWAAPDIGMHKEFLPEYFKTYNNMIFVGEQTSYTHAWIASALESGIRGSVQLMLELGLVDEAKATVEKWMARWIDV